MPPEAVEHEHVSLAGYTDLNDRPGFKIALDEVDGRWSVYVAHMWHRGWSVVDVTDPRTRSW